LVTSDQLLPNCTGSHAIFTHAVQVRVVDKTFQQISAYYVALSCKYLHDS